jgi:hypothetical protein
VPDFRRGKVAFKEDNTLDRSKTPTVLNANDYFALEAALEAKVKLGGTVHVVCMGPPNHRVTQRASPRRAGRASAPGEASVAPEFTPHSTAASGPRQ